MQRLLDKKGRVNKVRFKNRINKRILHVKKFSKKIRLTDSNRQCEEKQNLRNKVPIHFPHFVKVRCSPVFQLFTKHDTILPIS